jgi:5-bromo-4-chloroindolyl phosphate hydrolysis protein
MLKFQVPSLFFDEQWMPYADIDNLFYYTDKDIVVEKCAVKSENVKREETHSL